MNHQGYVACLKQCFKMRMPKAFKDDLLIHDFNILHAEDAPKAFVYSISQCGTHLFELVNLLCDYTAQQRLHYLRRYVESAQFFVFYDGELHPLALELITEPRIYANVTPNSYLNLQPLRLLARRLDDAS